MDTSRVNVGVSSKDGLITVSTLFLATSTTSARKISHSVVLISHWPVTESNYCKCWLLCKPTQYILVSSWMQAQSLAQDATVAPDSTAWPLTWISHAHLNLTCPPPTKFLIIFSNAASLQFPPSQDLVFKPETRQLSLIPHSSFPSKPSPTPVHLSSKNNTSNTTY